MRLEQLLGLIAAGVIATAKAAEMTSGGLRGSNVDANDTSLLFSPDSAAAAQYNPFQVTDLLYPKDPVANTHKYPLKVVKKAGKQTIQAGCRLPIETEMGVVVQRATRLEIKLTNEDASEYISITFATPGYKEKNLSIGSLRDCGSYQRVRPVQVSMRASWLDDGKTSIPITSWAAFMHKTTQRKNGKVNYDSKKPGFLALRVVKSDRNQPIRYNTYYPDPREGIVVLQAHTETGGPATRYGDWDPMVNIKSGIVDFNSHYIGDKNGVKWGHLGGTGNPLYLCDKDGNARLISSLFADDKIDSMEYVEYRVTGKNAKISIQRSIADQDLTTRCKNN